MQRKMIRSSTKMVTIIEIAYVRLMLLVPICKIILTAQNMTIRANMNHKPVSV